VDVLGQPISPIFKGRAAQEEFSWLLTFRDNLSVPSSSVEQPKKSLVSYWRFGTTYRFHLQVSSSPRRV